MRTKIIAVCLVATVLLTGCTASQPPIETSESAAIQVETTKAAEETSEETTSSPTREIAETEKTEESAYSEDDTQGGADINAKVPASTASAEGDDDGHAVFTDIESDEVSEDGLSSYVEQEDKEWDEEEIGRAHV